VEPSNIIRFQPVVVIRLDAHLISSSELVELVHIDRRQIALKGLEDIAHIDPERFRLDAVHVR